jgi:hypothetical protein
MASYSRNKGAIGANYISGIGRMITGIGRMITGIGRMITGIYGVTGP